MAHGFGVAALSFTDQKAADLELPPMLICASLARVALCAAVLGDQDSDLFCASASFSSSLRKAVFRFSTCAV